MKKLRFFNRIVLLLNGIVACLLLLSYLAPVVNPNLFWPISVLGLGYPFLLLANILFMVYWLVKMRRHFLMSLIIIAIGYNNLSASLQFNNSADETESPIKVMSYNVRLFDLYNWSNNKQTRNKMFHLLKNENPDIVCFQEFFYSDKRNYFNTKDTLTRVLGTKNYHVETVKYLKADKQHFAIATYSKYRIIHKGKVELDDHTSSICIYTDLLIGADTVRVYNAHMASIKFATQDYNFIDSVAVNSSEKQLTGAKNILKRLRRAYQLRAPQALKIAEHIEACSYPIIFCTDMNDTPVSFSYNRFDDELCDSFTEHGSGFGSSYNGKFPAVRIDYIFHSDDFECVDFKTLPDEYSDHFPITAILSKE